MIANFIQKIRAILLTICEVCVKQNGIFHLR
jgi:hypothetical protein